MVCVAWQPLPLQHHFCHTHTTVTVIGGTAKHLLGSSTDWCATTIVTPHTRGATSTHTHGWQSGVVWPMCCDCCVHQHLHGHFTLPHHLCVSPHQPSVCHHPFHHPFAFLSLTPFLVCVWHCQATFTLSLCVLMHWRWHQCPSYGAHHASHPPLPVCVVMAFLHCPGPVNHLPPFLCVFWCVPQATASICTDRGGYALWCCLPQK